MDSHGRYIDSKVMIGSTREPTIGQERGTGRRGSGPMRALLAYSLRKHYE